MSAARSGFAITVIADSQRSDALRVLGSEDGLPELPAARFYAFAREDSAASAALVEAARIYRKHLDPFVQYFELGPPIEDAASHLAAQKELEHKSEIERKLARSVDDLELSVRAANCLASQKITTLRELVTKTEQDLLSLRNFGQTSLAEVKGKLTEIGLDLGMQLD